MKFKIVIMILAFISLLFSPGISAPSNDKKVKKNVPGANNKVTNDNLLRMKFDDYFDQTPAFILVKLKNIDTKEHMDIVCTNNEWRYYCINYLKLAKNKTDYIEYMVKYYDKIFETPSKLYGRLMEYKADDTYTAKYKTKEALEKAINSGELKGITAGNIAKNKALLKLLLKFTPIIRQNSDGTVFEDAVPAGYKNKPGQNSIPQITAKTLKERFSDFSTSPVFVLIKIKNAATKEETEITCVNETWARICVEKLKLVNHKGYTDYMVKNYNKTFEVDPKTYESLKDSTNPALIEPLKQDRIIRINCLDGTIMY